jgi:outer membrane biosynthesis protein TonB
MRKHSSRIVSKRLVCLRPAALALLGSAVFSGTAHAGVDAEVPAPAPPPAEVQEVPAPPPPAPEVQEVASPPPPAPEVREVAPPPPPAPEVQEVAPPPPPAPEVPEVASPPPPAPEVPEVAPAPEVQEVAPPPAPPHEAPEGLTPPVSLAGAAEVAAPAPDAKPTEAALVPVTQAAEAVPEAPNSLSGLLIIAGGGPGASSVTSPARPASVGSPLGTVAAQEAAALSCELHAVVRGGTTDSCFAGWLAARGFPSQSPMGLATDRASLTTVAAADAFSDGGHGGSAVVRPPAGPAPGPAPSGVSGGSSAGASGLALSAYLTLAGLLLLGGPRAMRRLRLSCEQWRAACFVLIPERPG